MFATLIALTMVGQNADQIALVRYDAFKPESKAGLFVYQEIAPAAGVFASDPSFLPIAGGRPARQVFGIDLNGDRIDELGVVREQVAGSGRYSLAIHPRPTVLFADATNPILKAKPTALGTRDAFGEIVDVDGIDVDGDFRDEVMIVRRVGNGLQRLEIFATPKAGKDLGPALASYLDIGTAPFDTVRFAVAVDVDGDAHEEIALVKSDELGTVKVVVIPLPKSVGELVPGAIGQGVLAVGGPIFTADATTASTVVDVDATDFNNDGIDELLVLNRSGSGFDLPTIAGGDRVDSFALPADGVLPLLATAVMETSASVQYPVAEMVVLRGKGAKPNVDGNSIPLKALLDADFTLNIAAATNSGGYAGGGVVSIGPITGAHGDLDETTNIFRLEEASLGTIGGAFHELTNSVALAAHISLPNPLAPNDVVNLTLTKLTFSKVGTMVSVFGTVSGVIETPFGQLPLVNGSIFGLSHGID